MLQTIMIVDRAINAGGNEKSAPGILLSDIDLG